MGMNTEKLAKKALEVAVAYVRKQIKKDQENLYSLKAPWELPTVKCSGICKPFNYENEYLEILKIGEGSISVTVKPYESTRENPVCDGDSLAPDLHGCLEAAILHDPWYASLEDMSSATGISQNELRALGDAIFGNIIVAVRGDGIIARAYYWAVRAFGGIYHSGKKQVKFIVAVIAISVAAAGCAGCAIPDVLDGDTVNIPIYEKAN